MRDDENLLTGPAYVGESVYQPGPENFSTIGGQPRVGDIVLYRLSASDLDNGSWPPAPPEVAPMIVNEVGDGRVVGTVFSQTKGMVVINATQGPGPGQWQWRD